MAALAVIVLSVAASPAKAQYAARQSRVAYRPAFTYPAQQTTCTNCPRTSYVTPAQPVYQQAYAQPSYGTYAQPGYTYAQPGYTSYYAQPAATAYAAQPAAATPAQPSPTSDVRLVSYTAPAQPTNATQAAPAQAYAPSGDPYGFTNWLNATRASYGLPAVGYDGNLESWAAMNNGQQAARGLGHYVMGPARRQNSAMGNAANIGAMWMNSPAHRAALLDPSIRAIGLAGNGSYWTFNAY